MSFLFWRNQGRADLKIKCNADERCRRRLDGADPLISFRWKEIANKSGRYIPKRHTPFVVCLFCFVYLLGLVYYE